MHFTQKPLTWFALHIKELVSICNGALGWNGLKAIKQFFWYYKVKSKNFDQFFFFFNILNEKTLVRNVLILNLGTNRLTLPAPCILEICIKIKLTSVFNFTLLCDVSKGFQKAFKAFMKPFEAPQKSVRI